jgi:hypothetical protein
VEVQRSFAEQMIKEVDKETIYYDGLDKIREASSTITSNTLKLIKANLPINTCFYNSISIFLTGILDLEGKKPSSGKTSSLSYSSGSIRHAYYI